MKIPGKALGKGSNEFWTAILSKAAATLASVTVWGFLVVVGLSTWLLLRGSLEPDNWTTVVTVGLPSFLAARKAGSWLNGKNGNGGE